MTTPNDPYALPDSALPDSALPDSALPDSAMDTRSESGEPGEHLGPDDLDPEEKGLLAALERDAEPRRGEENLAVVRAAEDDVPLPEQGGDQDDGLTPRFSSPGDA
jgi:hypothetical protein